MYLYRDSNSVFHRLHPVVKILLLVFSIVISFLSHTLRAIGLVLVVDVVFLLAAGGAGNLKSFWKALILFWIFTFLIWIIVPRLQHQPWSYGTAILLATRTDTFVVSGLLFVTITRIEEFTLAMTKLGIPYRAAFTLSLGFRLVPLFYQNLQTIVAAQRSRGVDLKSGGPLAKAKNYIPIFGVLISYSLRNADLMAMSLEAKGFGYPAKRTSFLQPRFGSLDLLVLFAGAGTILLLLL
jgi:energy-coupling factor transport system permease protein